MHTLANNLAAKWNRTEGVPPMTPAPVFRLPSCSTDRALAHLRREPRALRIVAAVADGSQVAFSLDSFLRSVIDAPQAFLFLTVADPAVLHFPYAQTVG